LPQEIETLIRKLLRVYGNFFQGAAKAKKTLTLLRQAMGFIPKSEKGRPDQLSLNDLSPEKKQEVTGLKRKRDALLKEKAGYDQQLRRLIPKPRLAEQMELALDEELMFSTPAGTRRDENSKKKVSKIMEFGFDRGLHTTQKKVKRTKFEMVVTDVTYEVETCTDPKTGKTVRASMKDVGPENSQLTWGAIANLVKLHVGFAIPTNRIEKMIGQPEFTSSKICRTLKWSAEQFLPIYLHLFESLSDAGVLSGDDTGTKVLNLDEPMKDEMNLASQIDEQLGWAADRADGQGKKKSLNVSLLMGRTEKDPRSTIRFYRTHLGSVGNLLTKILEWRTPKAGALIFQGDLSATNYPNEEVRQRFQLEIAGCGAHARRPFFRYKEDDGCLCYFMLRGFLTLSQIEKYIDAKGRTEETVLKWRNRYGRKVWQALRNRCIAATTGEVPGRFTYRKGDGPNVWPPGTELYKACRYVIKHFEELTFYLDRPQLQYTNNASERALRIEKCMLSSSKFRKSRNGRAVLDVLRTINATCTAAKVEIENYLMHVTNNMDKVLENPENYTPYAMAKKIQNSENIV
jgi:hypothetical protein